MKLDKCIEILKTSELVRNMLSEMVIEFKSSTVDNTYFRDGVLHINNTGYIPQELSIAISEIRAGWHIQNNNYIHDIFDLRPDDIIVYNRTMISDLTCCIFRAAWEMHLSQVDIVYHYLNNSPESAQIFKKYCTAMQTDFRGIKSGEGYSIIFEDIALSNAFSEMDKSIITSLMSSSIYNRTPDNDKKLTHEMLNNIFSMPNGEENRDMIAHTNVVLTDPIFTEVRERGSANFLWFIKFERASKQADLINRMYSTKDEELNIDEPTTIIEAQDRFLQYNSKKSIDNTNDPCVIYNIRDYNKSIKAS